MNDGYLLADCAFKLLVDMGFMHYSDWKHNTKELYYTASFTINGTRASIVSFEVTVSDGCHRVSKSIIRILEKRYSQNFNTVFLNCVLN